jgi:hypothetical protein
MDIEWAAEHVRVSLFASTAVHITEDDWRAVTGQNEADARQAIAGGRVFSGRFEAGLLNFSGAFNRMDIIFASPPLTEQPAEPQLPTVGPWISVRDRFFELTHKWIESTKFPIIRVAFGAVLLSPVPDRKSAYEVLKKLLSSVAVDPNRMQELLYRVNWPTQSKAIRGLTINRITNWSAIQFTIGNIPVLTSPAVAVSIPLQHAVRLEIDHNTDLNRSVPFSPGQTNSIFKELVSHASENALNGECK